MIFRRIEGEELPKAANLTAERLQHATEIVEGKFGADRSQHAWPLVGWVLIALAENFRQGRLKVS